MKEAVRIFRWCFYLYALLCALFALVMAGVLDAHPNMNRLAIAIFYALFALAVRPDEGVGK